MCSINIYLYILYTHTHARDIYICIYTHTLYLKKKSVTLTCIWSPAKTILVFLLASARGIIVSHSIACAASSNRMCVKKPVKQISANKWNLRYDKINSDNNTRNWTKSSTFWWHPKPEKKSVWLIQILAITKNYTIFKPFSWPMMVNNQLSVTLAVLHRSPSFFQYTQN